MGGVGASGWLPTFFDIDPARLAEQQERGLLRPAHVHEPLKLSQELGRVVLPEDFTDVPVHLLRAAVPTQLSLRCDTSP